MKVRPSEIVSDWHSAKPAGAEFWHLWAVWVPRRSITGRLVWGRVWRRHNGRHWLYKRVDELGDTRIVMKRLRARSSNLSDPSGEDITRGKGAASGVDPEVHFKLELPTEPPASAKMTARPAMWPYVWLALSAIAMTGWLAAIVWIAVAFAGWLWDF